MSKKAQSRREATKQNVGQSNEGEEVGDTAPSLLYCG